MLSRSVLRASTRPAQAAARHLQSAAAISATPPPPPPPGSVPAESKSPASANPNCASVDAPLARLPTSALVRSLALHGVTLSPPVMKVGMKALQSQSEALAKEGLLKWAVDKTFYAQFCSGSKPEEIRATIDNLRSLGFAGVILAYAREVEAGDTSAGSQSAQIAQWLAGTLKTIAYTDPGDFVAVKYTGAGSSCLPLLAGGKKCYEHPELGAAMLAICEAAKQRGVKLLLDAEQQAVQAGVDAWSLSLIRQFNKDEVVLYNTYQMYLKASPRILAEHLAAAKREGFHLGVKLVRGAYLHSDPRHLIHDTKADTDAAYDGAVEWLLTGRSAHPAFPDVARPQKQTGVVVASHNKASVQLARDLRKRHGPADSGVGSMVYAQLMGMADELSMGLIEAANADKAREMGGAEEPVRVYKYAVWGTTQECVKYLIRRAEENKDSVGRSRENVQACWDELKRRKFCASGMARA